MTMIFYKPYGLIALAIFSALAFAAFGIVGMILIASAMGVMAIAEMKFDDIAKLAQLEKTSYRLVSFDVDDGTGTTVRKFKVEMHVEFPIGWSAWHNTDDRDGYFTEEQGRTAYDSLLNDHKASLVRLRTKRSKGTNGRIHAIATIADIQRLQAKTRVSRATVVGSAGSSLPASPPPPKRLRERGRK